MWAVLMVIILGADERTIFAQFLHPKKVTVCIICVFPTIAYAFMGGSRDVKDLCKINRSPIYKRLKHFMESEPHPQSVQRSDGCRRVVVMNTRPSCSDDLMILM